MNKPLVFSLAASVLLSVSFLLFQKPTVASPFIQQALAHSHHPYRSVIPLPLQQVNAQLASKSMSLSEAIGKVYFAKRCVLDNIETIHLVLIENGSPVYLRNA